MKTVRAIRVMTLLAVSLLVSACSSIAIRTSVEIDAPRDKVFAVLADFSSYPECNPYHRKITGVFEEGADLVIEVLRPDGKQFEVPPHLIRIVENEEISWGGGLRGVFYGEHRFLLQPSANGGTLLMHNEDFSGFAIGFADLPPDVIAQGYQQMNHELKAFMEDND